MTDRISTDLTFQLENGCFNYRTGAIIVHNGRLLLMKNSEEPYYYSVGGRVHFNETTEEAVVREVREEIGVDLEIERFLFFQEQFFDGKVTGTHIHELGVYYLMKDSPALENIECHSVTARGVPEELVWIPLDEINKYYIVPESVAARLGSLPDHPEHIIEVDER
ncbi:MAG: NUDIX domain-containing protein [Eubacteriales bacterium]|nr:NUDIX domain-containing protein [Eubacteriales bacterium]